MSRSKLSQMREHERLIVGGIVSLILILTPGFFFHSDPRFAGSLPGSIIGMGAALLMSVALTYPLFKRVAPIRRHFSMRGVLQLHIFAGVIGPLLAMFHSGHKFDSSIGVGMIVAMLVLVTSGFLGRYYLSQVSSELREDRAALGTLQASLVELEGMTVLPGSVPAVDVVGAVADIEQAIDAKETLRRASSVWMAVHVGATFAFFLLLGLHVWSSIYFGLRWLR